MSGTGVPRHFQRKKGRFHGLKNETNNSRRFIPDMGVSQPVRWVSRTLSLARSDPQVLGALLDARFSSSASRTHSRAIAMMVSWASPRGGTTFASFKHSRARRR